MRSTLKSAWVAGAYVCGEETSLLESLEGSAASVRAKPPLPAHKGLFGQPTVINNVLSLSAVPYILSEGAQAYHDYGMGVPRGTMPIQLAGNISTAVFSKPPSASRSANSSTTSAAERRQGGR